jgi:hypothetical protein
LVDEQRTCRLSTERAERVLALEANFLTLLRDALSREGSAADEGAAG